MIFLELDDGDVTLVDIKRIAKNLVDNKYVLKHMTPEQYEEVAYILTPTLASDQNEDNIRKRWEHILATFSMADSKGNMMRFYQDPQHGRIYFGDEEGWKEAQNFIHRENDNELKMPKGL
ncbi:MULTISPECIES: hypothetical protein [unclassified Moraxella]|uniref:hypothetical protein n=1 Tax=unclassified Moraxella TaxID=2685852 RepID=UPI003AF8B315